MGLFDFLKKPKTELEEYYDQRAKTVSFENSGDFEFTIQDVFSIKGRGTVVTGRVMSGRVQVGDRVMLERTDGMRMDVKIGGIESFRKLVNEAIIGDNVGILIKDIDKNSVKRGDRLTKNF